MARFLLLGCLLVCLPARAADGDRPEKFFSPLSPPRSFQVMTSLADARQSPPNTRAALALAVDDGVEWIAADVRTTKDHQHVLGGSSAAPREHALDELQRLDVGRSYAPRFAGAKLLSLEDCLALAKGKINLCLDSRDADLELLVRQIRQAGMERQVAVRDAPKRLQRVRELSDGRVAVIAKWEPSDGFSAWLDELQPAIVQIRLEHLSGETSKQFHDRGILVAVSLAGSADQPTGWDRALAAGADILETSVPEEVVAHVLAARIRPRPVRFASHRGASRYAPENTLAAFDKAYRLGADFVEIDVRPTRDGTYYLLHDSKLDRTTNGQGAIRDATSADVEALDAGSWFGRPFAGTHVPTLDAFLAAVPPGGNVYFDAKDIPPQALAAALDEHGLVERTVVYQSAEYLEQLKAIDPRIRRMPPARTAEQVTALAARLQPYAVDTPWTVLSREYIDHAHAEGVQVFSDAPFIVGVKGYRRAIEWGIDLIQTDHPLRLWRAMELVADQPAQP